MKQWTGEDSQRLTATVTRNRQQLTLFTYGFDQQGWYGMFVAGGIWCLADVSSVSPSSEQTQKG